METTSPVKPIKPSEVGSYKAQVFPSFVLEAFNELIAAQFTNGRANVKQKDVIELILDKANAGKDSDHPSMISPSEVFDRGWLNIEEIYRAEGWKVEYDRPAYYESYDTSFTFREK